MIRERRQAAVSETRESASLLFSARFRPTLSADISNGLSYISSCFEILANQGYMPQFIFNSPTPQFPPPLLCNPPANLYSPSRPSFNSTPKLKRPEHALPAIPSLPLTPSRAEEDAMDRALHGSCACGRNRYIVEIPAGSAQLAELTYDNSSAARKSKISSGG